MNREILFRGKRIDTGEWIEGWYCKQVFSRWPLKSCIIPSQLAEAGEISHFAIIPETVGPFTGLTDKNGRKIFEGDIIEAHLDELFPDLATTLIVVWSNYGWFGRDMEGNVDSLEREWVSDFFEIIGNIHDNPEMLEVSGNNG